MKKTNLLLSILFVCLTVFTVKAQNTIGGTPPSFIYEEISSDFVDLIDLKSPDINQIEKEDKKAEELARPYRYAIDLPVNMGMDNAGTWSYLPDGSRIWRIEIRAEGAKASNLEFDQFWLPKNTRLYAYDKKKTHVLGAYTHVFNREDGSFSIPLIGTDHIVLELYIPFDVAEMPILNISNMVYAYRDVELFQKTNEKSSDYCEVDIACSEGNNWRDQEKGVCRISIKNGANYFWCTGSLVNNTGWDCKNYVLLADHCADDGGYPSASDLNNWRFYFNYQSSTCGGSPNVANTSVLGCSVISHFSSSKSDFYLVEFTGTISMGYQPYYNGWIRSNTASNSGVGIHHPSGDIKKISTYTTTTVTTGWYSSGTHWGVKWATTANGHGVSEHGSSGSPLFNSNGLIMGTLTGGASACDVGGAGTGTGPDEMDAYGKFYYHWDKNSTVAAAQLKPWLDPGGSMVTTLPGFYCNTGIENENIPDLNIFSYPNPTTGIFTVEIPKTYSNKTIYVNVYDVLGEMVWSNSFDNNINKFNIDLSGNTAGVYYINVSIGDKIATKKITLI